MTYLEKFRQEHPEFINETDKHIMLRTDWCPDDWGFRCDLGGRCPMGLGCVECWDREIPGTEFTNKNEKETKKMITRKTKAELLEELEQKNNEIRELKKEVEKVERYKAYDDMASEIKAMQDSFVNAGFREEMANQMVLNLISQAAIFAKR